MLPRRVPAAVSALLLLTACTDSSSRASSSSATGSGAAAAPTDELPDGGSFPADTGDDGGPGQAGATGDPAGRPRIGGLRLSTHSGFTRLVVDLSSSGVPEWTVGYSEASGPGGGRAVIAGDAFLRLQVTTGAEPGGQSTSDVSASPGPIAQARTTGLFEGYEEVLIGVRGGELPFRAFALTDPGRIVIDVRPQD